MEQRCLSNFWEIKAMISFPFLVILDFSQPFLVECDAFGLGITIVLMQKGHPIGFESRKLIHGKNIFHF